MKSLLHLETKGCNNCNKLQMKKESSIFVCWIFFLKNFSFKRKKKLSILLDEWNIFFLMLFGICMRMIYSHKSLRNCRYVYICICVHARVRGTVQVERTHVPHTRTLLIFQRFNHFITVRRQKKKNSPWIYICIYTACL